VPRWQDVAVSGREGRFVEQADLGEFEARGRNLRRRATRGYRRDDVDDFLSELIPTIRDLQGENEAMRTGGSPSRRSRPDITPFEVQERRFRGVRFGGYDMRAVDDYLDEATDLLAVLIHERDLLLVRSGTEGDGS
jgi:DivIVA domain-containing protein